MKAFLNAIIVIGYILFGSMWLKSLYQVAFYNSIVHIFEFKNTSTTQVRYLDHSNEGEKVIVAYEFKVGTKIYKNDVVANREAFGEKVGMNEIHQVYFNSFVPNANYLENWKLDNYFNFTFVLFSIFLSLVMYAHLKVDKVKWIGRYRKALNS